MEFDPVQERPIVDGTGVGRSPAQRLDERIRLLEGLRDGLTECIGCGCLSLRTCWLSNPDDRAAAFGTGPRYLLGNSAEEVLAG